MRRGKPRKESLLVKSFQENLRKNFPDGFIYKIPDTFGIGGMRPFDMIAILGGRTFCLEFKRGNISVPTPYQEHCLNLASTNGATTYLVNESNASGILKAIIAIANPKGGTPCP